MTGWWMGRASISWAIGTQLSSTRCKTQELFEYHVYFCNFEADVMLKMHIIHNKGLI